MRGFAATVDTLALVMFRASGLFLVLMMMVTMADITTRGLFGATDGAFGFTLTGAVEIVSYSLLFMILFALPHSVSRGQVVVDVFTIRWTQRTKARVSAIYMLGFGVLGAGMCLGLSKATQEMIATGQTTQDLQIPLWLLYGVAAFATAVLGVRAVIVTVRLVSGQTDETASGQQATPDGEEEPA